MSERVPPPAPPPRPAPGPPHVPPPRPPAPDEVNSAAGAREFDPTTRLRCAAWQDARFRDRVLVERWEHRYRAEGREPGLHAAAVVAECRRARATLTTAGILVAAAVALMAFFNIGFSASAALFGIVAAFVLRGQRGGSAEPGGLEDGRARRGHPFVRAFLIYGGLNIALQILLGVFGVLGFLSDVSGTEYAESVHGGEPEVGIGGLLPWPAAAAVLFALLVGIGYWTHVRRNSALNAIVNDGIRNFSHYAAASGVGSVPVGFYSSFSPFVGAGIRLTPWPLTLDLRPARTPGGVAATAAGGSGAPGPTGTNSTPGTTGANRMAPGLPPGPELVEVLYQALRRDLGRLGEPGGPASTHRGVDVADCVFVSGLRHRPPGEVSGMMRANGGAGPLRPEWVRALVHNSHERARHFIEAGVAMWEGQVVLTAFVKLSVHGGSLRIEGETFVMPPISPRYGVSGRALPTGHGGGHGELLWSACAALLPDSAAAIGEAWRDQASRRREWKLRREYARTLGAGLIDFSPRISIRRLAGDDNFRQLFQDHDVQRLSRAITKRCLTSLADGLRNQGYDTRDLEGIVQNINLGLQNFGGSTSVNGIFSVGGDNTINQTPAPQPAKS
ncbi:hypothetical protein GCM10027570_22320 [Streptomonospora sediminis]